MSDLKKKKSKKNKIHKINEGFTLIEMLGVVVILGIISSVAIVSYSRYVKKAKQDYYSRQEDLLVEAGKDFFMDNRGRLPQKIDQESCVLLSTLIKNKYIDEILDYSKKSCNSDESKVCARKISSSKYIYYSKLLCDNYQSTDYKQPTVTITPEDNKCDEVPLVNKTKTMVMKIGYKDSVKKTQRANIEAYQYIIYKKIDNSDKYEIYYDTGIVSVKGSKTELSIDIDLESDGTFYVWGMAYNSKGLSSEAKSCSITLQFSLDCDRDISFNNLNDYINGTWTNKSIKTKIKAVGGVKKYNLQVINRETSQVVTTINDLSPTSKIGEITDFYTHTLDKEGTHYYKITAFGDEKSSVDEGISNSCEIESENYLIDKTPPKCNVKADPTGWTQGPIDITAKCTESVGSLCKQDEVKVTLPKKSFTKNMEEDYLITKQVDVLDNAGNKAECNTVPIKIDKTGPSINVTGYLMDEDSNGNLYYVNSSGAKVANKESAARYGLYNASASAANVGTKNWSKYYVRLIASGEDKESGLANSSHYFIKLGSATGLSEGKQNDWYECTASEPRSYVVKASGESVLKMRNTNNVGITKESDFKKVYVDREKPTIKVSTSCTTDGNVEIKITGTDKYSGLDKYDNKSNCQYYIYAGSKTQGDGQEKWITCGVNNNYIVKADGTSTMKFRIKDKVGNETVSQDITVAKPCSKLSCEIVETKGSSSSSIELKINGEYKDYGLSTSSTAIYNSKNKVTGINTTATYYGYVRNSAGATASCKKKITIDKTKPNLNLKAYVVNMSDESKKVGDYKSGSWTKNYVKYEFLGSDSESSIKKRQWYVNSGSATQSGSPSNQGKWIDSASGTYVVKANGTSTMKFKVCDEAGNCTESGEQTIKIDNAKPGISLKAYKVDDDGNGTDSYTSGKWTSKNVKININGSDNEGGSGIDKSQWYVNSGSATQKGNQGKWVDSGGTYIVYANGKSTMKFRKYDKVGNYSESGEFKINIDKEAPEIIKTKISGTSVTIGATDNGGSGIASYCLRKSGEDCDDKWQSSNKFTGLKSGTAYYAYVKDNVGHNSEYTKVSIDPEIDLSDNYTARYCTMHNGVANASHGSTTVSCSGKIDGSNCFTDYNGWALSYGGVASDTKDKTYANIKISDIDFEKSANKKDLLVTIKFTLKSGYVGSYQEGEDRKICLKKSNRTYTGNDCTSKVYTYENISWGSSSANVSKVFTQTFRIEDYASKKGSYSMKMWDTKYETSCSTNINAQIFSFQTDYLFKIK